MIWKPSWNFFCSKHCSSYCCFHAPFIVILRIITFVNFVQCFCDIGSDSGVAIDIKTIQFIMANFDEYILHCHSYNSHSLISSWDENMMMMMCKLKWMWEVGTFNFMFISFLLYIWSHSLSLCHHLPPCFHIPIKCWIAQAAIKCHGIMLCSNVIWNYLLS